jgi:hypothetical protein
MLSAVQEATDPRRAVCFNRCFGERDNTWPRIASVVSLTMPIGAAPLTFRMSYVELQDKAIRLSWDTIEKYAGD